MTQVKFAPMRKASDFPQVFGTCRRYVVTSLETAVAMFNKRAMVKAAAERHARYRVRRTFSGNDGEAQRRGSVSLSTGPALALKSFIRR